MDSRLPGFRQPIGAGVGAAGMERAGGDARMASTQGQEYHANNQELPQSRGQHLLSNRPYYGNDESNLNHQRR